jgi:hypothetical protein
MEVVEKHQQVPVMHWFLTGVAALFLTTVKSCACTSIIRKIARIAKKAFILTLRFRV